MYFFLSGIALLAIIISLFWLKDQLRKPLLTRFVYSGLVARLAVLGAAFVILGFLIMVAELV
jgi:hypothetical protein